MKEVPAVDPNLEFSISVRAGGVSILIETQGHKRHSGE